jgi:hypothetical protein
MNYLCTTMEKTVIAARFEIRLAVLEWNLITFFGKSQPINDSPNFTSDRGSFAPSLTTH